MALIPKFSVLPSQDKMSFFIQDDTGVYSASNPTGYGAPNPEVVDVTNSTMIIVKADGTSLTLNAGSSPAFYPLLPNTLGVQYEVTNIALGLEATDEITDWIPLITYTVVVSGDQYIVSRYAFVSSQSDCCVATLAAAVDVSAGCDCDNSGIGSFSNAWDLNEAIKYAVSENCQKPNKANKILEFLKDICNNNCGC